MTNVNIEKTREEWVDKVNNEAVLTRVIYINY